MTVRENVQVALLSHRNELSKLIRRAREQYVDEADALLERVGMKPQAERPCSVLATTWNGWKNSPLARCVFFNASPILGSRWWRC